MSDGGTRRTVDTRHQRRRFTLSRWRDEAVIAALLAALACGIALNGWAWRLDRLLHDWSLTIWSRPAPSDIVIVAIDDASVNAIGKWPWSRATHATLLQNLARARPRAIALDILFPEDDPVMGQDELLAQALRDAGPVVLPVAWEAMGGGVIRAQEPHATLRAAARLGAADASVDGDGVMRDAFLHLGAVGDPKARYPHFALALLEAGGEAVHPRVRALAESEAAAPAGAAQVGAAREGRFAIRYIGPPGSFERIPYAEVLAGTVPAERLAGRYVLVGMTAQGMGDTLATPVNRSHLAMPGIEAHANTLYTLKSGDTIAALHETGVAALSAALVAALVLAFGLFGPRVALPLAVVSVPLVVALSMLGLRQGHWISPVAYALPALLAYPLWSWRRLERAVQRLDVEIARLMQTEPHDSPQAGLPASSGRHADGDVLDARLHTLRRAGTLVRDARRFLAEALAAMPTAMLVADSQARVVLANARAAALFEVESPEELLNLDLLRLLDEFTPTAGAYDWPAALAALQPGGAGVAVEVAQGATEGRGTALVVQLARVQLQGQDRLIVTLADVEPVKQAQRDREEVLAFVSHDLRSPASSIVLLADMHLQGQLHTPLPELLQEVRRLAGRTLSLSEGLVRAAQVQSQPLARSRVALAALCEDALADLRTQALAAGIELQTAVDAPAETVDVDRLLLGRAIVNLLSNAIKHGPAGTAVVLSATLRDGRLKLGVRDHGRGLNVQQLEQLARGDEGAAVADASGVGLGLLFVQRVARRHGGLLRASAPADGAGAFLEIDIPA